MRLLALELRAFGPFTDVVLDFERDGAGSALHVLYGQNEAGKSSALRALTGFLYGIPPRTSDDHVHRKDRLRIGARLLTADGRELHLIRRKGSKNTLLDTANEPVDEAILGAAIAGVGQGQFTTMFGLDHDGLRRGVDDMLAGHGDVGESLYDAGVGGRGIHDVLLRLEEEADALFTPRGKKRLLNEAIERFKELRQEERDQILRVESYEAQQTALTEARDLWDRLDSRRRRLYRERETLSRDIAVLPELRLREELLRRRSELGSIPPLAVDGPALRSEAQRDLRDARLRIGSLERDVERLRTRRDALDVPEALAELAPESVAAVERDLGRHRSATQDRPRLLAKRDSLVEEIRARLRAIGRDVPVESIDTLRIRPEHVIRIRKLASQHTRLEESVRHADKSLSERQHSLAELRRRRQKLPPALDIPPLRRAVTVAITLGQTSDQVQNLEAAIRTEQRVLAELARQSGAGSVDELLACDPPTQEVVDRFDTQLTELARRLEQLEERASELRTERRGLERDLSALAHAGGVPDETQLADSRQSRDDKLLPLREALVEGHKVPLTEVDDYERTVAETDAISDRLRREAERVARKAALLASREAADDELAEIEDLKTARTREHDALKTRWALFVSELPATEPGAVRGLHGLLEQARRRAAELTEQQRQLGELRQKIERAAAELRRCCSESDLPVADQTQDDAGIASLLAVAQTVLAEQEGLSAERTLLDRAEQDIEAELVTLEAEVDDNRRRHAAFLDEWEASVAPLELGRAATPEEANGILDRLAELFGTVDKMGERMRRIDGIDRDARDFASRVGELVERHSPDLVGHSLEDQAQTLLSRYRRALENRDKRAENAEELDRKNDDRQRALDLERRATQTLDELCARAAVETVEELEAIEVVAATARKLDEDLTNVERRLLDRGDGLALETLAEECKGLEIADLRLRKDDVDRELAEVDDELRQAAHDIGTKEQGLVRLREKSAASTADDAQAQLARVRALTRRYARTRLAAALLRREIERYRQENQGPILSRATELFPRLTLGTYSGLRVGFGAGDDEVLRCVRRDGSDVGIEGLSEGTRYQLYLALRLATLERHVEHNPPLPFVLDDVLIHFDDDRARAALEVLGEIAEHAQVLFFTHHKRLLELAREAVPAVRLREHDLSKAQGKKRARRKNAHTN